MKLDLQLEKCFYYFCLLYTSCNITVNKNTVPKEKRPPFVTSGIRIGTCLLYTSIQEFNTSHPNIEVQPVFIPGSDLLTKIQLSVLSGQTPELAISDIIGMPLILDTGKVIDLMPYVKKENYDLNDFYENTLVYGKIEDKLFSLPVSSSNLGLFWNKELFKKAGLDPEPVSYTHLDPECG